MTTRALLQQHIHDLPRRVIAEQLSQRFLVPLDSVPLDQFKKVLRLVERQRGLRKMRILRDEVCRRAVNVGEVAAPAAGDQDLSPRLRIVLQQQNSPASLSRNSRTHQSRRAGTEHNHIEFANFAWHIFIVAEPLERILHPSAQGSRIADSGYCGTFIFSRICATRVVASVRPIFCVLRTN